MSATKRGIYYNLKESKYTVSDSETVFFFSSMYYLEKFLNSYKNNRVVVNEKISKVVFGHVLNMDSLADITLYKSIEKRGFRVLVNGVEITWHELNLYALRKMTSPNTKDWRKIQKPKLVERVKMWV